MITSKNLILLTLTVLSLVSCKKDKIITTPTTSSTSGYKTIGSDYTKTACVYSQLTTDGSILTVLMKANKVYDLVKITSIGNISWATTLGSESFHKSVIKELSNDVYIVSSSVKTYVVNKTGVIIKNYPIRAMDGVNNGSSMYLVNMDYSYKLDMNYNLLDSFPNLYKLTNTIGYYAHNLGGGCEFTNFTALFRGNNKIQYFYQKWDFSAPFPSPLRIINCNLDNSLVDSFYSTESFSAQGFSTFKTNDNHIILATGSFGWGAMSFWFDLYKYDSGSTMQYIPNSSSNVDYTNMPMCESGNNKIFYTSMNTPNYHDFLLKTINSAQNNVSTNEIISDSTTINVIGLNASNIAGLVSQPGTENFYLITAGNSPSAHPQIIKINGTPEVINF
jgi:hypothetical protein